LLFLLSRGPGTPASNCSSVKLLASSNPCQIRVTTAQTTVTGISVLNSLKGLSV
jgi:hypothetical protein